MSLFVKDPNTIAQSISTERVRKAICAVHSYQALSTISLYLYQLPLLCQSSTRQPPALQTDRIPSR
jgi:hypothetical protein